MKQIKWSKKNSDFLVTSIFFIIIIILWKIYGVGFLDTGLFFFAVFFIFTLPGLVLLFPFREKFTNPEYLSVGTVVGIVGAGVANLVIGIFCQQFIAPECATVGPFVKIWSGVFFLAGVGLMITKRPWQVTFHHSSVRWWPLAVAIVLFCVGNAFFHNAYLRSDGTIGLDHMHDMEPLGHIQFAGELGRTLPPIMPFYYGEKLKGYHFLADLVTAQVYGLTKIDLSDLYFRMLPTLFALLLLSCGYWAIFRFCGKRSIALFWALLIFIGGDLSLFFMPVGMVFQPENLSPISMWGYVFHILMINHQTGLWGAIFFAGVLCLVNYERSNEWQWGAVGGILFGASMNYLAFGGLIAIGSIGIIALFKGIFKKNRSLIPGAFLAGIFALPVLFDAIFAQVDFSMFKLTVGWYIPIAMVRMGLAESIESVMILADKIPLIFLIMAWIFFFVVIHIGTFGFRCMGLKLFVRGLVLFRSVSVTHLFLSLNILIGILGWTFLSLNYPEAVQSPNTAYFIFCNALFPLYILGAKAHVFYVNHSTPRKARRLKWILLALALPQFLLITGYTMSVHLAGPEKLYGRLLSSFETKALMELKKIPTKSWCLTDAEGDLLHGIAGRRIYFVDLKERQRYFLNDEKTEALRKVPRIVFNTGDPSEAAKVLKDSPVEYIFSLENSRLHFTPCEFLEPIVAENGVGLYRILREKLDQ